MAPTSRNPAGSVGAHRGCRAGAGTPQYGHRSNGRPGYRPPVPSARKDCQGLRRCSSSRLCDQLHSDRNPAAAPAPARSSWPLDDAACHRQLRQLHLQPGAVFRGVGRSAPPGSGPARGTQRRAQPCRDQ